MRIVFASLLFLSTLSGCASFHPSESQAWLVLKNSLSVLNVGSRISVYVDGVRVGELPREDGPYLAVKLTPGQHEIRTKIGTDSSAKAEVFRFEALAGKKHYFVVQQGTSNGQLASFSQAGITAIDERSGRALLEEEMSMFGMGKAMLSR